MAQDLPFLLVANWKMNLLSTQARELYLDFCSLQEGTSGVEIWVASPAVHIALLSQEKRQKEVPLGAQNVLGQSAGAFTGEISPAMLLDYGATFSLVGHSERRTLFREDDALILERTRGALRQGLTVIHCVGESLVERERGLTNDVLQHQLSGLSELFEEFGEKLILAYEPVWAIGTGKVATLVQIDEAHRFIKSELTSSSKTEPRVLYGGSVKGENIREIRALPSVDGGLIGGASLKRESFAELFGV